MSFGRFLDYLSLEKAYSPHTVRSYVRDLEFFKDFCQQEFSSVSVMDANYSMIRSWMVTMVDQGITARSINRKISSLRAYYRFLQRTGDRDTFPLANHKALKVPKKVQVPFSEKELRTVLDELPFGDDFEGVRNKLIIELFYTTGMRRIELIQLRLPDVDVLNLTLKVLGKRNKERYLPLMPNLTPSIECYLTLREQVVSENYPDHFFLTSKGDKLYEMLVYRIINDYFSIASSKVKKSPHILRHTFATHLLNKGADLYAVKELLGHSSLASTQVYTHSSIGELQKVYDKSHPRNKE